MADAKSGMNMLMKSLMPGLDMNAIEKTATTIGNKVIQMESTINSMDGKIDQLLGLLIDVHMNTMPAGAAGETPILTQLMLESLDANKIN